MFHDRADDIARRNRYTLPGVGSKLVTDPKFTGPVDVTADGEVLSIRRVGRVPGEVVQCNFPLLLRLLASFDGGDRRRPVAWGAWVRNEVRRGQVDPGVDHEIEAIFANPLADDLAMRRWVHVNVGTPDGRLETGRPVLESLAQLYAAVA